MTGLNALRADIERLGRRTREDGRRGAPAAFEELVQRLLTLTVARPGQRVVLKKGPRRDTFLLEGAHDGHLVELSNRRWLEIAMTLQVTDDRQRLKVDSSVFQYLWADDERGEIFRYDYLRAQRDEHPCAHLNIHRELDHGEALPTGSSLKAMHFPVGRTSLESVIRLLAEDFKVTTNEPQEVWRAALSAAEAQFWQIAHLPNSGPDH